MAKTWIGQRNYFVTWSNCEVHSYVDIVRFCMASQMGVMTSAPNAEGPFMTRMKSSMALGRVKSEIAFRFASCVDGGLVTDSVTILKRKRRKYIYCWLIYMYLCKCLVLCVLCKFYVWFKAPKVAISAPPELSSSVMMMLKSSHSALQGMMSLVRSECLSHASCTSGSISCMYEWVYLFSALSIMSWRTVISAALKLALCVKTEELTWPLSASAIKTIDD